MPLEAILHLYLQKYQYGSRSRVASLNVEILISVQYLRKQLL